MKSKRFISCLLLLSCWVITTYAQEPGNLDSIKQQLMQYHDTGLYLQDQKQAIEQAENYLSQQLAAQKIHPNSKPLAIILDIDETSLSNYPHMIKRNFGGTLTQMKIEEVEATDPVIAPTLMLYQFAKANHVAVFFVTGRREDTLHSTTKNLIHAGFKNWDGLFLKPITYHERSAASFKTRTREQIEKQGYKIVLNIGDQQSDFVGGHADQIVKMPNPYYTVP